MKNKLKKSDLHKMHIHVVVLLEFCLLLNYVSNIKIGNNSVHVYREKINVYTKT